MTPFSLLNPLHYAEFLLGNKGMLANSGLAINGVMHTKANKDPERPGKRDASRVFKNRLKYDLISNQIICRKYDLKSQSNLHFPK
jgi:hypothetical protein